ncbi:MAG TPA: hypothetical protein VEY06_08715, partial [Flavisolibacter sp.]|nr:hypothetical protein [Flavisolibacter sp.]
RNYKLQTFKYPWLLKDSISSAVGSKGIDAALQIYENLKQLRKPDYLFNELQLHTVGTELLLAKKNKEAVAIFKLNAEEYPKSWRVFNNLGDAYSADGNNQSAKEAYEKSLRFNALNANAIEALKRLN